MQDNISKWIFLAKETIQNENQTIQALIQQFDNPDFYQSIRNTIVAILKCTDQKGRVIITGVGKSGHIGQKAASTFSSTGTPAVYIHPTELLHGDLGNVLSNDLIFLIGKSGESIELLQILPHLKNKGCTTIAITATLLSSLARQVEIVLYTPVSREACPLDLAPTSSTTSALALLDGLAVSCMSYRGFTPKQFSEFHPGGQLGRRLLMNVSDLMIPLSRCPILDADTCSIENVMQALDTFALGVVLFNSSIKKVGEKIGIMTDGDLRKNILLKRNNFFDSKISDLINFSPLSLDANVKANEAIQFMESRQKPLNLVLVKEKDKVVGVLRLHELLK